MTALLHAVAERLPRNRGRERGALISALIAVPVSAVVGSISDDVPVARTVAAIVPLAATAVVVWVRSLPRLILAGSVGGGFAGLMALGAGSRLAMRVVSLLGGRREVTFEGTMFLLIGGLMLGATVGVAVSAALRAWPAAARSIAVAVGSLLAAGLLLDSEAFAELVHEGAGAWINFPMFLALPYAYGILATRSIGSIERRIPVPNRSRPHHEEPGR